jgi:hypothetical protein
MFLTSLQEVLWQHFIFNVFAFIPILNDKKYYIKMYLLGCSLFPLFNNFDIYTKGILVLIMNYLKQLILMFSNFVFLLDEKIITNGRQLLGSVFLLSKKHSGLVDQ